MGQYNYASVEGWVLPTSLSSYDLARVPELDRTCYGPRSTLQYPGIRAPNSSSTPDSSPPSAPCLFLHVREARTSTPEAFRRTGRGSCKARLVSDALSTSLKGRCGQTDLLRDREGAKDEEYAFAVVLKNEERIVGSTAYLSISARHRRAEVGSTWYLPEYQRTFVNPECKLLLLKHAFEDWEAVRMQLGTDANNIQSQRAILKLGAKFEGRLRNHGIRPGGKPRDTMLYSIISSEWPEVKSGLVSRINSY